MVTQAQAADMELSEALTEYLDQEKMYHLRNVKHLTKVVEAIGYKSTYGDSLAEFFEDNPGAIEAVYEWISNQNSSEWRDAVVSKLRIEDGDGNTDDGDEE